MAERLRFLRGGTVAYARVVEVKEKRDSDGDLLFTPVFEYATPAKTQMLFEPNFATNPSAWHMGDGARVVYHGADSRAVKLVTYYGAFDWAIVFIAIGLPLLVVGIGYHLAQRLFNTLGT